MARTYQPGDEPVPGYRLDSFLGQGAFGQVWKAIAPGGTEAALKIISLSGKQGLKEFRALRLVKGVRHPNLVPIVAYWLKDSTGQVLSDAETSFPEPDNRERMQGGLKDTIDVDVQQGPRPAELVIAMGLGEKDLSRRLDECRAAGLPGIPVAELLDILEDSAPAIDYLNSPRHRFGAESVGIQHCDIKPFNIMIVGGAAQVCDFGLARMLGDVRKTATTLGTVAYIAPECLKHNEPSSTTDQYSLAITYVELRTGKLPYENEHFADVVAAVLQGQLSLNDLPIAEREVIRRATMFDPAQRYPSSLELVRALRRSVAEASGCKTTTLTVSNAGLKHRRQRPIFVTSIAALVVATTGVAAWQAGLLQRLTTSTDVIANQSTPEPRPSKPLEPVSAAIPTSSQSTATTSGASAAPNSTAPMTTDKTKALLVEGQQYFDAGDYPAAIAALTTSIRAAPVPPAAAYLLRGTCYLEKGECAAAIADLSRVVELNGRDVRGLSRRATAHLRLGDDRAAIADFSAAIALEPDARDYVSRGIAHWRRDETRHAIDDFTAAIAIAHDSADGYFNRALVRSELRLWQAAVEDFEQAIKHAPDNTQILIDLARLLASSPDDKVRKCTRAVELAKRACQLTNDKNAEALHVLAAALAEASDFATAISREQQAISIETDPALLAQYRTSLRLYEQGKPLRLPLP